MTTNRNDRYIFNTTFLVLSTKEQHKTVLKYYLCYKKYTTFYNKKHSLPGERRGFITRFAVPYGFYVTPLWNWSHILRWCTIVTHHTPTAATVVAPKEHCKRGLAFHALCDSVVRYPVIRSRLGLFGVVLQQLSRHHATRRVR